jgi:hypothetical protein
VIKLIAPSRRRFASQLLFVALVCSAISLIGLPEAIAQTSSPPKRHQMISLVVLSNSYIDLKATTLAKKLDELYPGKFVPMGQQDNFVVGGPTPGQFLIKSTMPGLAGIFMLLSVPAPYTEFSDFNHSIPDASLRRKAEAQKCWLSVDLVQNIKTDEEAYRFIGAVLAKLAPPDTAVLVRPENNSAMPFDDGVRRQLASGEPVR